MLKLWRTRNLTLEGKIIIFKSLALSKIVYTVLMTEIPNNFIDELNKIQRHFIWGDGQPKIKHETLRMDYKHGGLKNVDITLKFISLQCSWVKRLFDNCFHNWKVIPLHLI